MCSKVLNGHIILTDTSITTILAPEMTYTPLKKRYMLCDNSDSPGYAEHHEVLFHIHIHKPYSVVAYVYDCYDTPRLS